MVENTHYAFLHLGASPFNSDQFMIGEFEREYQEGDTRTDYTVPSPPNLPAPELVEIVYREEPSSLLDWIFSELPSPDEDLSEIRTALESSIGGLTDTFRKDLLLRVQTLTGRASPAGKTASSDIHKMLFRADNLSQYLLNHLDANGDTPLAEFCKEVNAYRKVAIEHNFIQTIKESLLLRTKDAEIVSELLSYSLTAHMLAFDVVEVEVSDLYQLHNQYKVTENGPIFPRSCSPFFSRGTFHITNFIAALLGLPPTPIRELEVQLYKLATTPPRAPADGTERETKAPPKVQNLENK